MKMFDYVERNKWLQWIRDCAETNEENECKIVVQTGRLLGQYTVITTKYQGKAKEPVALRLIKKDEPKFCICHNGKLKLNGWTLGETDRLARYYDVAREGLDSFGTDSYPITRIENPNIITNLEKFEESLSLFAKFVIIASFPLVPSKMDNYD